MNVDIITHSILYNTDNVKESIELVKECSTHLADLCIDKQVKEKLYSCYNKYEIVANALIKDYDISEQDKTNRFIVLEELINTLFSIWKKNKKSFKYKKKRETVKYLYDKKGKAIELLHYNEFSLFKFINRYFLAGALAILALLFGIVPYKAMIYSVELKTVADIVVLIAMYLLFALSMFWCISLIERARNKERFIRPTSQNRLVTYIGIALPCLFPLIIWYIKYLWDSLKFQLS